MRLWSTWSPRRRGGFCAVCSVRPRGLNLHRSQTLLFQLFQLFSCSNYLCPYWAWYESPVICLDFSCSLKKQSCVLMFYGQKTAWLFKLDSNPADRHICIFKLMSLAWVHIRAASHLKSQRLRFQGFTATCAAAEFNTMVKGTVPWWEDG